MPIEIKITELHKLTGKEIKRLIDFLIASSNENPTWIELLEETVDSAIKELMGDKTNQIGSKEWAENRGFKVVDGDQVVKESVKPKPRKKRKGDPVPFPDIPEPEEIEREPDLVITEEDFKGPPVSMTSSCGDVFKDLNVDVTYGTLIAYVLEATRTKKLDFADVMKVVEKFDVLNLQALEQLPHLVSPVYYSLKEFVNE